MTGHPPGAEGVARPSLYRSIVAKVQLVCKKHGRAVYISRVTKRVYHLSNEEVCSTTQVLVDNELRTVASLLEEM